jgi:hypothetical protein
MGWKRSDRLNGEGHRKENRPLEELLMIERSVAGSRPSFSPSRAPSERAIWLREAIMLNMRNRVDSCQLMEASDARAARTRVEEMQT